MKERVWFVCVHNSARSQMAEGCVRKHAGERFEVESAGLEPGTITPVAAQALLEEGMDMSHKKTSSASDFFREGRQYRYVIAVCSKEAADRRPIYPGLFVERLYWPLDDPSAVPGTPEGKLGKVREIRDRIKRKVLELVAERTPA